MSDNEELGILDVKAQLENVFKGCEVVTPYAGTSGYHATVIFYEYEVRVILAGSRASDRPIHFRFMQRAKGKGKGNKVTKFIINEMTTTDPKELTQAINDAKEYLLGIVHAIKSAFTEKPVARTTGIADLLKED